MSMKFLSLNVLRVIILFTIGFFSLPSVAVARQTSEQQLIEKRMANEEAQAEYYRTQTAKLREPVRVKTFWENIAENPASSLGVVGAVIVALVTLVSFIFNYRATLKNQRDTQFYEALKRFGDNTSPSARSSAAGLLARMSRNKIGVYRRQTPYFETGFHQLIAGLQIEENPVVIASITVAIKQIVYLNPRLATQQLYQQNLELQSDMLLALADVFAVKGIEGVADNGSIDSKAWNLLTTITGYNQLILNTLINRYKTETFDKLMELASTNVTIVPPEAKPEQQIKVQVHLRIVSIRLRANVEALGEALKKLQLKGPPLALILAHTTYSKSKLPNWYPSAELDKVFLARADISYAILKSIHLRNAQLQEANLTLIQLDKADLYSAHLEGARLSGASLTKAELSYAHLNGSQLELADLQEAKLYSASLTPLVINAKGEIRTTTLLKAKLEGADLRCSQLNEARLRDVSFDDDTDLGAANWWAADFASRYDASVDEEPDWKLLEALYKRHEGNKFWLFRGEESVLPTDVHNSVRKFISSKNIEVSQ
jgi:uncharacterized protein YjbI with pentapeptide repeats